MQLRDYLKTSRIKGSDFARDVGISAAYLSQLTSGVRSPSLAVALKIADLTRGAVTPKDFGEAPAAQPPGEAA